MRAEWLCEVVVGAHLEANDSFDLAATGRQHNDRDVAVGPQAAAKAQAVLPRQHDVEYRKVDAPDVQHPVHLASVARDADPKAARTEKARDQATNLGVVLDEEDVRSRIHA